MLPSADKLIRSYFPIRLPRWEGRTHGAVSVVYMQQLIDSTVLVRNNGKSGEDVRDQFPFRESSRRCSVALLVLRTGAAPGGIVSPNFRPRAHGLGRFGLGRPGLKLEILLLATLALLDLLGLVLRLGRLHQEQEADRLGIDPIH